MSIADYSLQNDVRFLAVGYVEESICEALESEGSPSLTGDSYRVLLTRGRDGFIVFVPNEIGKRSTYEALMGAGIRTIENRDNIISINMQKMII